MHTLKLIFWIVVLLVFLLVLTLFILFASETKNFKFENSQQYLSAYQNKKLGFGFLPPTLPICASDIHATYNIDTNRVKFDFICENETDFLNWLDMESDFLEDFSENSMGELKIFIIKKQLDL